MLDTHMIQYVSVLNDATFGFVTLKKTRRKDLTDLITYSYIGGNRRGYTLCMCLPAFLVSAMHNTISSVILTCPPTSLNPPSPSVSGTGGDVRKLSDALHATVLTIFPARAATVSRTSA